LKEHPFFKSIDWRALSLKQVVPPFRPVVESDESTANFDPEFTSADVRDSGIDIFDDDDPSDAWVSSLSSSNIHHNTHTYLGPNGNGATTVNGTTGGGEHRNGMAIKTKKRNGEAMGTPLTSSVQEKFRGFTYSAESMMPQAAGLLAQSLRDERMMDIASMGVGAEEAVEDEEEDEIEDVQVVQVADEDDEWEDEGPAGRYAGHDISIE
jgi:serine/threonine protein kinase SCH9